MPKYIPPQGGVPYMAWSIVFLIPSVVLWLLWNNPYLLLLIPVVAIWALFERRKSQKRFDVLVAERRELSICEFARSFNCKVVDTWIIRAVYEQLQEYLSGNGELLAIKADDHIYNDLEIDEEDFQFDLVEEISQRTGRSLEFTKNNTYYNDVNTIRDLVLFFNEQPLSKNT